MLRSLVGSEMCIRDRLVTSPSQLSLATGIKAWAAAMPAASLHSNVASKACLLYTSDAADDLLCVDLGGRRIIKKKNTKNNADDICRNQQVNNIHYNSTCELTSKQWDMSSH